MKLVSIIIPTYNNAHLIGETLDSIMNQTYSNWECIVVDDDSNDTTDQLMATYVARDQRISYAKRPNSLPKGGNPCRNYGFQLSKGDYIQWFDSDDIMRPTFLDAKIGVLRKNDCDFVISKSLDFDGTGEYPMHLYDKNTFAPLTARNFIFRNVFWMTPDFMCKRVLVSNHSFNEKLQSGQETNFFITLLTSYEPTGIYINEELTLRRLQENSIQQKLKKNRLDGIRSKLLSMLETYRTIDSKSTVEIKNYLQYKLITMFFDLRLQKAPFGEFLRFSGHLIKEKGWSKAMNFVVSMILHTLRGNGKGYELMKKSRE